MNCPLCGRVSRGTVSAGEILSGEVCHCQFEPPPAALPPSGDEKETGEATLFAPSEDLTSHTVTVPEKDIAEATPPPMQSLDPQPDAWRNELSARLDRYRSRRKMRPPRYPSLSLQFNAVDSFPLAGACSQGFPRTDFEPVSDHALALDSTDRDPTVTAPGVCSYQSDAEASQAVGETATTSGAKLSGAKISGAKIIGAKIIEFPRSAWAPPPPPLDQLAEPVSDRPRILEVPEIAPPAPALGGITIEAAERQEIERRPGIDFPLPGASLSRRLFASVIDGLIIAVASAMFGFIFWKVSATQPPLVQILGLAAGVPCLLWAAYQYLLIVYAARTPGLRLAGLELARFDGTATTRSLRRWRVLACYLSAASLGMGYAWLFLDEDILCWHDRITRTYLAPRKKTQDNRRP
jgi:uncharacterized RDD family membrane protein YckC